MADIEADVIIVGSGISGALLAARLSKAGVKIAILEAGARVNRSEATQRFWDAPIRVPECPYPPTPEADHPISNDPDYWYRQAGPNKFKSTYLKVVGGTTWHWLGTCLRFVPNDFRLRTAHGRGLDWPIGYGAQMPFAVMGIEALPTLVLFDKSGKSVWAGHSLSGLDDAAIAALAGEK